MLNIVLFSYQLAVYHKVSQKLNFAISIEIKTEIKERTKQIAKRNAQASYLWKMFLRGSRTPHCEDMAIRDPLSGNIKQKPAGPFFSRQLDCNQCVSLKTVKITFYSMLIEPPKSGILCGRFVRFNFAIENVKNTRAEMYI